MWCGYITDRPDPRGPLTKGANILLSVSTLCPSGNQHVTLEGPSYRRPQSNYKIEVHYNVNDDTRTLPILLRNGSIGKI